MVPTGRTPDRPTSEQLEAAWIGDTIPFEPNRPVKGEGSGTASSLLSKENLEWHNAIHPKSDQLYAQAIICEERARAHEVQMYEDCYGEGADPLAGTAPMPSPENSTVTPLKDVLKLYRGPLPPSSETPMRRFVTLGPTQDPSPWLAKNTMEYLSIGLGDLETVSIRRLAAELIAPDDTSEEDADEGTPFSSSPTLSAPRAHRDKRVAGVTRVQKSTRRRVRRLSGSREAKGGRRRHG